MNTRIHRLFAEERVDAFRLKYRGVNVSAAVLALASFVLFRGGVIDAWGAWVALFQALCLLALMGETLGVYIVAHTLRRGYHQATLDSLALLGGVGAGLALLVCSPLLGGLLDREHTLAAFAYLTEAGLLAFVGARLLRLFNFLARLAQSPLKVFVGSFLAITCIGAGLLMLPGATTAGWMHPLDALFMSTSATCVTGLVVADIATEYTRFGQVVILALFQIGGLGIMTFAAFFALMFGRGMGIRDSVAMGEVLDLELIGRVGRLLGWILGITLICEALGTWALYGSWVDAEGLALPAGEQLYYSVFHSVSAFCQAGFSLQTDGMVRYLGDWPVVLTISSLVIVSGLGFTVVYELLTYRFWAHPIARRVAFIRRKVRNQRLPHLSMQTKMVLGASLILLLVGGFGFWILESSHSLRGLSFSEQLAAAIFHGVTPRSSGFNTLDVASMSPATHYFTILLMFIGTSPGSTGGGLKTTTCVVLALAVVASLRGRQTEIFRRRIPSGLVQKCMVILVLSLVFISMATLAMMVSESDGGVAAYGYGFERIVFEVVSAFGTVGLSTGITGKLTWVGELIIMICMFVGRVAPPAVVLAMGRREKQRFEYPEEGVMIG